MVFTSHGKQPQIKAVIGFLYQYRGNPHPTPGIIESWDDRYLNFGMLYEAATSRQLWDNLPTNCFYSADLGR